MEPPLPAIRDRRPDALGDLRVLEDETLCAIFDLLSPCDLARLSCVSSVMYILCNEEPLWMSQCLRDGGLLEYKGTWKKTILYRQNLFSKTEVCERPLQFDGFNSWFLYKRWYRCFTNLDKFASDSGVIERRGNIDLEEFQSDYDGKKPVLLTELARNWPARIKWTVDQLSLNYGDVAFRISQRSSRKVTMKLRDYVLYMEVQHDEDPLYIFDEKFGESAPALLNDYTVPSLFQEDFFDVLDPDKRPPFRWLIIGPERSGASWHVDPALTSAWNTLLVGRKRWALYPPGRVPAGVTVHVNEEDGDINIEGPTSLQWWLDIYPLLADRDKPLECTQLPGETIFVPSGWWHCVLNLETTVAVTQNFVNKSNFEFVCLDMAPGHRHKGVCRAGLLAVEDNILKDVESNKFSKTNILDNSDKARKVKRLKGSDHMGKQFQHNGNWHSGNALPPHSKILKDNFSYDISFLSTFLEENRDHYCSVWSPSNCIGQREMRKWLYELWVTKPVIRELTWKGAELVLGIAKWYACLVEVSARHNLPPPLDHEKFPVGTGSNPVYLVSDYVIKIYVEGGLNYSIYSLGTELQFYHILQSTNSPLKDHVPEVMASGILAEDHGFLKIFPWDGKAVPDVIANCKLAGDYVKDGFPFGLWSKRKTEPTADPRTNEHTNIWPYIVTKRCKGDIFANLRDALSMDDALHLAAFLGEQLRNLHLLPLPLLQNSRSLNVNEAYARLSSGNTNIPLDWELIIMALNRRRREVQKRLSMWGDPIPRHLIEMADAYLPHDLAMLLDLIKDDNGLYTIGVSPTWIHSDIMDDNIHMEPFRPSFGQSSSVNGEVDAHDAEQKSSKWQPTHIIDFSDLQVGDPLYDFIPIHLDVFRGDTNLLEQLLRSYRLPFSKTSSAHGEETPEKCKRISYRAMCYCILHDENVLGAIFSLWKELRTAKSWDEVEEAVWGKLNNYEGAQIEKAYEP